MIEHPVFVPFAGAHLAAIVTVPDGQPRGAVLLLQGAGGAPHSHRYRLWTRTARDLARRGLAAVRMDYRGIGDSTGEYGFDMREPPVEEALAVARLSLEALGVGDLGVAGNCVGARTALGVASRLRACRSVVCILPQALAPVLQEAKGSWAEGRRSLARRYPSLRRALRAVRGLTGYRSAAPFVPEVGAVAESGRLLILHGGTAETRAQLSAAVAALASAQGGARPLRNASPEVRFLPTDGATGLRPLETQAAVIDSIAGWMDECLPGGPGTSVRPGALRSDRA
ncbi:MAG: alpha/beta fold hydrolase [Actinobacteria bacterium]|nr:alpha/beta fold hydrolase [Actinomycetota bacterium]